MFDRIFRNWITTVLGLILLGYGCYMSWYAKIAMTDLVILVPLCITLILSRYKTASSPTVPKDENKT